MGRTQGCTAIAPSARSQLHRKRHLRTCSSHTPCPTAVSIENSLANGRADWAEGTCLCSSGLSGCGLKSLVTGCASNCAFILKRQTRTVSTRDRTARVCSSRADQIVPAREHHLLHLRCPHVHFQRPVPARMESVGALHVHTPKCAHLASEMCSPSARCPPTHSLQTTTPTFEDAHVRYSCDEQSQHIVFPGILVRAVMNSSLSTMVILAHWGSSSFAWPPSVTTCLYFELLTVCARFWAKILGLL